MVFLYSEASIYEARHGASDGRRHTDDYDKFVSRSHVRIVAERNNRLTLGVLSRNGIAVFSSQTGKWSYVPKRHQCFVFPGDIVSLHVVRTPLCKRNALTSDNMHKPSCFRIATEDDLLTDVEHFLSSIEDVLADLSDNE